MADRTSIDIEGTRTVIARLKELGLSFEQAAATMKDAASRYDGCWGNDEFGEAFAKAYVDNSAKTLEYIATLANNLGLTGDAVTKAVDLLVKTDENNAART
ncbi:hypothetical protein [Lentzea aerocolonigenes]|uniref:hypothetical protein n=1 Tax=Lentzea aerocolonigenes TaxID=68170 RepID=UPI000696CE68|nr:hypothetical protein [Lentzea aerocolonigenes]